MVVTEPDSDRELLTISAGGFGKRSIVEDYRLVQRGARKGVKTLNVTEKTGQVVAIKGVLDSDELMIVTQKGTLIRCEVATIRRTGRWAQGVKLISLKDEDTIADVTRLQTSADDVEDTPQGG